MISGLVGAVEAARRQALAEVQEKLTVLWKLESGRWEAAIQAAMNAVAELADGIAPSSCDPRDANGEPLISMRVHKDRLEEITEDPDAEIGMLKKALSECGQRRLSTEADNRRLREALAVAEDFVRRHGEEELADGIAALASAKGEGEVKA